MANISNDTMCQKKATVRRRKSQTLLPKAFHPVSQDDTSQQKS